MPDNRLTALALRPDEAAAFRPQMAPDYRGGVTGADYAAAAGNRLLALGRALLPPTPNEYMTGMTGYAIPPGAEVRSGIDGYGAEYRQPGGEWAAADRSGMGLLGSFLAPLGIGPAPRGSFASGVGIGRTVGGTADDAARLGTEMAQWDAHGAAKRIAAQLEEQGFKVSLDPSRTSVGTSVYMSITDPKTGAIIGEPIRFSDHSLGPTRGRYTPQVYNDAEAEEVLSRAARLRQGGEVRQTAQAQALESARAAVAQGNFDEAARLLYPSEYERLAQMRESGAGTSQLRDLRRRARQAVEKP